MFSEVAERIELCLFDDAGFETRADLPEVTAYCFHGYAPNVQPGRRYGFRVHGPWAPREGVRCRPSKLLIDPYARAIEGRVQWSEAAFTYRFDQPDVVNDDDSGPSMPKSIVVSPFFDWGDDRRPNIPWHETVIYEAHVKGFTKRMPGVPEELRGTYAGLAHPAAIEHLKKLGVTAIELLPVHHFLHDHHLVQQGRRNYWGYNTIGFFAPHHEYCASGTRGQQVQEFKSMVKALHAAGVEVILDVVYNHTAEGNHMGPTVSFKGLDNKSYYKLVDGDPQHYMDYTGTGNSFNMRSPAVLQLIMDSLRYWTTEMHVDGFRFDLAATLARELHAVDRLSAFFDLIQQDPVVRRVKLIAEPWDVGEDGYHVGNFPPLWTEWNGKFRDTVRDYWRGVDQTLPELANRLTGSSDLYENNGRKPYASINFVTCHDGFTLRDLVSYDRKHNEANGEQNRDGSDDNRSWNCGVEGPTDDPAVNALRARQQRNFLATLLLSQGVPMLHAGDELGRSAQGNNNTYCQDSPLSWIDWETADEELVSFTAKLIALRRKHPAFRRRKFFLGRPLHGKGVVDIAWFKPDGGEMTDDDWQAGFQKSLGVFLNGEALPDVDERGERVRDQDFFLLFNAHHEPVVFSLRAPKRKRGWVVCVDTGDAEREKAHVPAVSKIAVAARSLVVLTDLD